MASNFTVSEQDFKNLDGVEIKMTLSDEHRDIIRDLLPTNLEPQKLSIYFFDTPDLSLFEKHQIILRARSKANKEDDSTVKMRRVEPNWTFSEWRQAEGEFKVEGDWVSDKLIRSASFSTEQKEGKVERVALGKEGIEKLFSGEQERFLETATNTKIDFSTLKVLGPISVCKWKYIPPKLNQELCLEYWELANPDDILQKKQEILELSIKVECDRAQAMWTEFNHFLEQLGINPEGEQAPKTRTALDFFAKSSERKKFI